MPTWSTDNPDPNFDFEGLVSTVKWARHEHDEALNNPERRSLWNQADYIVKWDCGTAACIAGQRVLDAGYVPTEDYSSFVQWQEGCPVEPDFAGDVSVGLLAQRLFGINDTEAYNLFKGSNGITEVERYAQDIAEAHGYVWPN